MSEGNKNDIAHFCLNFNLQTEDKELYDNLQFILNHEGSDKIGPLAKRLLSAAAKRRRELIEQGII